MRKRKAEQLPTRADGCLTNKVSVEPPHIVAKVDELLRGCDALEARLTGAQTSAAHILDTTVHRILRPRPVEFYACSCH